MSDKDTITIREDDLFAFTDDDENITMSDWDWDSPLTTSLSTSMYPSATLGTVGTIGTVGGTLSTTTTGGLLWNNPTYTTTPYTVSNATTGWTTYNNAAQVLKVTGNAEFEGDIKIKGVSLSDRLDTIEERLGILRPNNDLEGKWEKLKKLGEEYRKLEKEILEGENIWDMLKK